jgi:RNA polymerase sigma-70 factor (ECF subfamily)
MGGSPAEARPPSEVDDEALVARVAARDEGAFRLLADRHLGRIVRLAQKMTGSAADADEIAQEALLRIWLNAERYQPRRARLATWIYRIVYNLSVDRLRRPRQEPIDAAGEVSDPAPSALDALAERSDLIRLRAALARLPERQRAALVLFYYEELSGEDAAEVLGLSLRAFWSLLHRARQAVQHDLQEQHP